MKKQPERESSSEKEESAKDKAKKELTVREADEDDSSHEESENDHNETSGMVDYDDATQQQPQKKQRKVHKLSMTQTEDFNVKLKKRGVVYIARIPPRMTPTKLKKLLQEISSVEITRVYLVEEDTTVRKRRRKENGGNGSKRYTEGWVELASKKVAKHLAQSLNNTPISLQKRNPHYGDLWNLKYLSHFQWSHLTEKVAYERRVKEQKLRLETLQARRETAAYKQLVATGQKLDKIEQRKRRREAKLGGGGNSERKDKDAKPYKKAKQVRPVDDGAQKSTHVSLLGSLV